MDQARILWAAMASSVAMIFAVTQFLPPGDSDGSVLNIVLPLVAMADVGLSFVIPKLVSQGRRHSAMLVALALCESAALLGLVMHLTTGWPNAWMLFALAVFGMVLHFPRST